MKMKKFNSNNIKNTSTNNNYSDRRSNIKKFNFDNKNKISYDSKSELNSKINYYENYIGNIPTYEHTHLHSDNIYWCWFQGFDNAPDLYKATFNSIKKNCVNHNIIIINETNFNKYIKFPSFILEKFKRKIFTRTHLSDLLRLELLIKYGGTWIDASVLMSKYDQRFFNKDLFFFKAVNCKIISGSSWFLTSEKASPVLKSTRDLIYEYWRKENYLCNYFLFHLLFKISYQKYVNDYSDMPYFSNIPVHYLQKELSHKFNYTHFSNILKIASVHKLTKRASSNKDSFANFIINKYLK